MRRSVPSTPSASSRFASAFSKRIGLTLCGIVELPVAPACGTWIRYPSAMYIQTSVQRLWSTPPTCSTAP